MEKKHYRKEWLRAIINAHKVALPSEHCEAISEATARCILCELEKVGALFTDNYDEVDNGCQPSYEAFNLFMGAQEAALKHFKKHFGG